MTPSLKNVRNHNLFRIAKRLIQEISMTTSAQLASSRPSRWSWSTPLAAIAAAGSFGLELTNDAFVQNLVRDGLLGYVGTALAAIAITSYVLRKLNKHRNAVQRTAPSMQAPIDVERDIKELRKTFEGIDKQFNKKLDEQRRKYKKHEELIRNKFRDRERCLEKLWHDFHHSRRDAEVRIRSKIDQYVERLPDFTGSVESIFEQILQEIIRPEFKSLCRHLTAIFDMYTRSEDRVWVSIRFRVNDKYVTMIRQGKNDLETTDLKKRSSGSVALSLNHPLITYIPYNIQTNQNCVVRIDSQTNPQLKVINGNSYYGQDHSTLAAPINAVSLRDDGEFSKNMRLVFFANSFKDLAFNETHEAVSKCMVDPLSSIVSETWHSCENYLRWRVNS